MASLILTKQADGFYNFAPTATATTRLEKSNLLYLNEVLRDLQEEGLGPHISFQNTSDPYLQYRLAVRFLARCKKAKKIDGKVSSKGAKHQIEAMAPEPFYVGQAYVILAARCLGFDMRPSDDRDAYYLNIVSDDRYWGQGRLSDWN